MEKKVKKFNFIDVIVLILIIVAIVFIFNRDKIFKSRAVSNIVTGKSHIIMTAKSSAVPMEVVEAFKVGDKAASSGQILDGEITDVRYTNAKVAVVRDGQTRVEESKNLYDLYVTFDMMVNSYAGYMEIGNQEIKVGVGHYISSENAVSYGCITAIEEID